MASTETTQAGPPSFGALAANALGYWEPRRLVYNGALALVVAAEVAAGWPETRAWLTADALLFMVGMAVVANIAYCAAYAVDLFAQFSELRVAWRRRRWILLLVGTAFAAVITHFVLGPGLAAVLAS